MKKKKKMDKEGRGDAPVLSSVDCRGCAVVVQHWHSLFNLILSLDFNILYLKTIWQTCLYDFWIFCNEILSVRPRWVRTCQPVHNWNHPKPIKTGHSTGIPYSVWTAHTPDPKGCVCFDILDGAGTPLATHQQDQMEKHMRIYMCINKNPSIKM